MKGKKHILSSVPWRIIMEALPHKLLLLLLGIFSRLPMLITPVLFGFLVSILTDGARRNKIYLIVCEILVLELLSILISWIKDRLSIAAFSRQELRLKEVVWAHIQNVPPLVLNESSTGIWMQKLSRDVTVIQEVCRMMLETGLGFIVFFFGTFLLVLWKAPLISLVFVAVILCTLLMHHFFHRRLETNSKLLRKSFYQEGDTLYGLLEMLPTLNLFGVTTLFKPLFLSSTRQLAESQIRQQTGIIHFNVLFRTETWGVHAVVLVVCTWLFLRGGLQVGDIVMYDMLIAQMLGGISQLMSVLPQLDMGFEYARSFQEMLLSEKYKIQPIGSKLGQQSWHEEDPMSLAMPRTIFKFRSVTFRYSPEKPPVISNFTTDIHDREFICFIGRNGSGKSTLAKLLTGIYAPDEGKIYSFGHKVATVPQHIVIYRDTLLENVRLRDRNISEGVVKSILQECGLCRFLDKHSSGVETEIAPGKISGGELQILGIVRALVRKPDVLILDELTNNLDVVAKEAVYSVLNAQRQRCTIVLITHDISCVEMADRVFVFHRAGISELYGSDAVLRSHQAMEIIRKEGEV